MSQPKPHRQLPLWPAVVAAPADTQRDVTEEDPRFAAFWLAYPRRVDKGHARKTWAKLIKAGADPAAIVTGAVAFAARCERDRTQAQYIPHPGTWLNGERWADEPESQAPSAGRLSPDERVADAIARGERLQRLADGQTGREAIGA